MRVELKLFYLSNFAMFLAIAARCVLGSFMYSRNARDDHRPVALISSSLCPIEAIREVNPRRKSCDLKQCGMPGNFAR